MKMKKSKLFSILNEVSKEKKKASRVVSVRLDATDIAGLERAAKSKGTTINKVLKRLIEQALRGEV
jgi:hypothetical protein